MFEFSVNMFCNSTPSCISMIWEYFSEISNLALLLRGVLSDTDKKSASFTQKKLTQRSLTICYDVCHKQNDCALLYVSFFYTSDSIFLSLYFFSSYVWSQTEFTCSLYFLQRAVKWIIATYLFYQSEHSHNDQRINLNMKRWKVSLFRGRPRRRSTCCHCAVMKSEYVKFVMHRKLHLFL